MKEIVPLAVFLIGIPLAIFAWLYQKSWDRQQHRAAYYTSLLDCLPAFQTAQRTPEQILAAKEQKDYFIGQVRHLWLVGPTPVVIAANKFLDAAKGSGDDAEAALKTLVLVMRRDTSILTVMFPFLRKADWIMLKASEIKLYSAT
jgi:hypothetical protein